MVSSFVSNMRGELVMELVHHDHAVVEEFATMGRHRSYQN